MVGVSVGYGVADGVGVLTGESPPGGMSGGNVGGGIWTSRGSGVRVGGVGDGSNEACVAVVRGDMGEVGVGEGVQVAVGGSGISVRGSTPGGTMITPGVWGGGVMTMIWEAASGGVKVGAGVRVGGGAAG